MLAIGGFNLCLNAIKALPLGSNLIAVSVDILLGGFLV